MLFVPVETRPNLQTILPAFLRGNCFIPFKAERVKFSRIQFLWIGLWLWKVELQNIQIFIWMNGCYSSRRNPFSMIIVVKNSCGFGSAYLKGTRYPTVSVLMYEGLSPKAFLFCSLFIESHTTWISLYTVCWALTKVVPDVHWSWWSKVIQTEPKGHDRRYLESAF